MLTSEGAGILAGGRVLKLYQYGFTPDLEATTFTLYAQRPLVAEVELPIEVRATAAEWLFEVVLADDVVETGVSYRLEIDSHADGLQPSTTGLVFEGRPELPPPTSLGSLQLESEAEDVSSSAVVVQVGTVFRRSSSWIVPRSPTRGFGPRRISCSWMANRRGRLLLECFRTAYMCYGLRYASLVLPRGCSGRPSACRWRPAAFVARSRPAVVA